MTSSKYQKHVQEIIDKALNGEVKAYKLGCENTDSKQVSKLESEFGDLLTLCKHDTFYNLYIVMQKVKEFEEFCKTHHIQIEAVDMSPYQNISSSVSLNVK